MIELFGFMSDIAALAGMLTGMNPRRVLTMLGLADVGFGMALFARAGSDGVAGKKVKDKALIDLSAYTTANKSIKLTVNGIEVTELTTTGTIADDAATLIASINAEVEGVVASDEGTTAGKINLAAEGGEDLTVALVYEGSDVTSSKVTISSDFAFVGVSVFHQTSAVKSRGKYEAKDAVACLQFGDIWVKLADGEEPEIGAKAYAKDDGTFTATQGSNVEVGVFLSENKNGIALVNVIQK